MKQLLLAIILTLTCLFAYPQSAAIKNFDPQGHATISRQEVYWIYTLRTRFWPDGTKITVYYQDFDSPAHIAFCRIVLNTTPYQFQNSVNAYINAGNSAYFRQAHSEQDILNKVSKTSGSVGYISDTVLLINDGGKNVRKITISD